jgi:putative membrane protein
MSGWGMAFMAVGTLLFWGLLVAGIVALVRYTSREAARGASPTEPPSPRRVLAERYARGEIDDEEYTRRLAVLDQTAQTPAHT